MGSGGVYQEKGRKRIRIESTLRERSINEAEYKK